MDGSNSTDHILAIEWAFCLIGKVVDSRSFPILVWFVSSSPVRCVGGGDLGSWQGGPVLDFLLPYEALLEEYMICGD